MTAAISHLDRIVRDAAVRRERAGERPVAAPCVDRRATITLAAALGKRREQGKLGIVAEVKRRSPSRGELAIDLDAARQARRYAAGGAAAISVLTDVDHFGGSLDDLAAVRRTAPRDLPVLCKDFIVERSQLIDARAAGADIVLLICALLPDHGRLDAMIDHAHASGLEVLLEVHDEQELRAACQSDADVIGINNRDLRSFDVSLAVTERLAPLARRLAPDRPLLAESGVRSPGDARRMRLAGAAGVLVGEQLVRAGDRCQHAMEELTCA